jgi:spore germination protein KA
MFPWRQLRNRNKGRPGKIGNADECRQTEKQPIYPSLEGNIQHLRTMLGNSADLEIRELEIGSERLLIAIVYTNGIVNLQTVNQLIHLAKIADPGLMKQETEPGTPGGYMYEFMKSNAVAVGESKTLKDWDHALLSLLSGETLIFIDGETNAIACDTKGGERRSVTEPNSQVVIRGPKEGFTESIGTNAALIRRRIKSPNLWLESMKIGKETHTDVAIMYLKGIANEKIVREIKDRLGRIHSDAVLGSGYIEQMIEDQINTPFPTIYNTERPDAVAGNLLEGRIAIIVDGTPFVLVAPATFFNFFQATEDYYQRPEAATAIRLLRYGAFLISMFGPSIYIAAITYHQEMIPTPLLISLAAQRETVPFPALIEALIMEVTFEILREAGIRMPRAIGQAVSIVGALVIGQAAVEAGIISPAMVIVVSLTGISSFATPSYDMALSIRLLRFGIMISAAVLGFYGIAIASLIILAHLCGLRSFGIPYMSPVAPFILEDHKDTFFRFPFQFMYSRPRLISQKDVNRVDTSEQIDSRNRAGGGGGG